MRFKEFSTTNEAIPALGKIAKGLGQIKQAVGQAGGVKAAVQQAGGIKGAAGMAKQAMGGQQSGAASQTPAQKVAAKAQKQMQQQLLKKGSKLPFPTQSGQAKEFEIDDVKGDEVTLINPDARNKPEEPEKMVYKKKDVNTIIGQMGQQ